MHAIKVIKSVKYGKTSVNIPRKFGNKVEITILPIIEKKRKIVTYKKRLLNIIGKAKISQDIFKELENGRNEDRF
jgi:hypothetical protein